MLGLGLGREFNYNVAPLPNRQSQNSTLDIAKFSIVPGLTGSIVAVFKMRLQNPSSAMAQITVDLDSLAETSSKPEEEDEQS